jgi:predicted Rossmann-fold nucleotide-binding protein
VGLLNTCGFYDHLLTFVDRTISDGFVLSENRALLRVNNDVDALIDELTQAP